MPFLRAFAPIVLRGEVTRGIVVLLACGMLTFPLFSLLGRVAGTKNHTDAAGPLFAGGFAVETPGDTPHYTIVSYNLRYGEAVAETIAAFRAMDPLNEADLILLQEMDQKGVERIAEELGHNYVYYPASIAYDGDNFGNAILSRWPIEEPGKLILPGLHPMTGQQRTATRATVRIGGEPVLVYSTHIEIATAPPAFRAAQFAAVLADIPADAPRVIVGGDFNTVTGQGVRAMATLFGAAGLGHDSAGLGPTVTRFGLRPSAADHIFSRGFERVDAGVLREMAASDHFPVWVRLASKPGTPPVN
jgi:endonuclease/exonuclease/phosphatase family metal-dependent hydrolase